MLKGDGNENGNKKKKKKSIGPISLVLLSPAYEKWWTYVRTDGRFSQN